MRVKKYRPSSRVGICKRCKLKKLLTRHSKIGNHKPPYEYICRECHDGVHHIKKKPRPKPNKKYQPGTPKHKRK